jgi:tellurite resistance protein TehA-like permease
LILVRIKFGGVACLGGCVLGLQTRFVVAAQATEIRESAMLDIIYIVAGVGVFVVFALYTLSLRRI